MQILVLNPGSATLKAAIVRSDGDAADVSARECLEWSSAPGREVLVQRALERMAGEGEPAAVGLRVVHGGRLSRPALVGREVAAEIDRFRPLAPFHNAVALEILAAARHRFPGTPVVAVFDTAYHATRAPASMSYALPPEITAPGGVRRYGFHGIAHESLARALARASGRAANTIDAVTLQLGAGCSACAISGGRSIETSMGFTPLEGLVMATRSGDVDPGLVLHLIRRLGVDEVEDLLRRRSGLLGMAGTADMREVLDRAARSDAAAALAIEVFVHRVVLSVGAYLTLLEGRGAIVFGGGIGARSPEIRSRIADRLAAWDVRIDPARNAEAGPIHADDGRPVYALETDEESVIGRHAAAIVRGAG